MWLDPLVGGGRVRSEETCAWLGSRPAVEDVEALVLECAHDAGHVGVLRRRRSVRVAEKSLRTRLQRLARPQKRRAPEVKVVLLQLLLPLLRERRRLHSALAGRGSAEVVLMLCHELFLWLRSGGPEGEVVGL